MYDEQMSNLASAVASASSSSSSSSSSKSARPSALITKSPSSAVFKQAERLMLANSFIPSHPLKEVGNLLLESFFSSPSPISVLTVAPSIVPCEAAFLGDPKLHLDDVSIHSFLPHLPLVKTVIAVKAKHFFDQLLERKLTRSLNLKELTAALRDTVLFLS